MIANTTERPIVGRGNDQGAELFRNWFGELTEAANTGRKSAYEIGRAHV